MSLAPENQTKLQRILILEENSEDRTYLSAILSGYFRKTELIFEASNLSEALAVIGKNQPSVVFTDIKFSEEINKIKAELKNSLEIDVVYTIQTNNPAFFALSLAGIPCLEKPFNVSGIMKVMEGLTISYTRKTKNLPHQSQPINRITLKSHEGITCISISAIRRLESDSNYTHFFLKSGEKITVPVTLKKYEDILPSQFFRTHQSHIVNLNLVKKFLKEDGGCALMDDGTSVLVSRRKKHGFLSALIA